MALVIPLAATANQTVSSVLAQQNCQLNVYQKRTALYMDIYLANTLLIGGCICEWGNRIIRNAYFGFVGDFVWIDVMGETDPYYTGIGTRYFLIYLDTLDFSGDAT